MDSESILEKIADAMYHELKLTASGQNSLFKNEGKKIIEFNKPDDSIGLGMVEKTVKELLKKEGYKVRQAYKNGIIEARNKKENYDIIITNGESYTIIINNSLN